MTARLPVDAPREALRPLPAVVSRVPAEAPEADAPPSRRDAVPDASRDGDAVAAAPLVPAVPMPADEPDVPVVADEPEAPVDADEPLPDGACASRSPLALPASRCACCIELALVIPLAGPEEAAPPASLAGPACAMLPARSGGTDPITRSVPAARSMLDGRLAVEVSGCALADVVPRVLARSAADAVRSALDVTVEPRDAAVDPGRPGVAAS